VSPASNRVSIVLEDLVRQRTETNLLIMADWQPPQISLQSIELSANGYELSLYCRDNFSIAQLQVNSLTFSPSSNEYTFAGQLAPGETLRLSATDRAGNRVEWQLGEEELRQFALQREDAEAPRLYLADSEKIITLYNDEYALDIRAEDDVSLQTVQLNGEVLLTEKSPGFRTFRRIPLTLGTNRFVLAAEDATGKRTEKQITIIRRKPEYLDRHYRLATDIPPISGELPDAAFERRTELLFGQEITRDPIRFYLLATKSEVAKILNELTLSSAGLADPRAALKAEKFLDSDLIFINRVLSDGDGQTIYTQVLDTESGEKLFIEDVYLENRQLLPQQINGLVMKLEQRFPLLRAKIVKSDGRISINGGHQKGIREGTRFLVIHSDGSFERGRVLQSGNRPVELIVSEIESASSRGIINPGTAKGSVQSGDYVFTR